MGFMVLGGKETKTSVLQITTVPITTAVQKTHPACVVCGNTDYIENKGTDAEPACSDEHKRAWAMRFRFKVVDFRARFPKARTY